MRGYILTIGSNPSVDKTVETAAFSQNHENRVNVIGEEIGGKAINVARALSHMNYAAHCALVIGSGSAGRMIENGLAHERFSSSALKVADDNRTNLTVRCGRHETRILEQGPRLSKKNASAFSRLCIKAMDHASAVIISGRNATGLPDDFCARLTVAAKKNGLPVAVDTSGPALRASIAAEPTVIKPNAAETAELLGIPVDARKPKTIETALRTLRERGIPYPIISVGKDGAFTLDGSQIICVRPPSLGIVTTVGCGDSLLAGFMASYVHKKPIACALREATAWAAANTQSTVHGKIDRAAVARLRKHCIVTFLH